MEKGMPDWVKNFRLQDAPKGYTGDLDKAIDPTTTIQKAMSRLRAFGNRVLRNTLRIDSGRLGIPVYISLCGTEAERVIGTKKQMGKGGSPEQAEASALMELVERYSLFSFRRDQENFWVGSFEDTKGLALSVRELWLSVNDREVPQVILKAFGNLPLRWAWSYCLTDSRPYLVPFEWFWAINEYNGSSAGNLAEEAILQGICEVVERHVSALVSAERLNVPRIELDRLNDSKAEELLLKFKRAGILLYLSDFSLDTGIPTVGALAYDPSTYPHRSEIVWTAGTTTSPEKSLIRAITEVAQLAGDFDTPSRYVPSGLPKPSSITDMDYILKSPYVKKLSQMPDISHPNMKVEIERAVQRLSAMGLRVYVLDITHPKIGIPAFYTVIPGAHFRERAQGKMGTFVTRLIYETLPPSQAYQMLRGITDELKQEHYAYFYLGEASRSLGRYEEAVKNYELAEQYAPMGYDQLLALTYKSLTLKEMGDYKGAVESLNRAITLDPESSELYSLLGNLYYKLGEFNLAIEQFLQALHINPASAIDYANIGTNLLKLGKRDEAIHYYETALRIDPNLDYARDKLEQIKDGSR